MGKLVVELKGKLTKSKQKAMLFAALCGEDNKFVAKVLNEYKYTEVQKEMKNNTVTASNDELENIAHYAILALKDIPTGKGLDSVKKARPFVESITSLMNESKDELKLSDYCMAILFLRELRPLVLPKDLVVEPKQEEGDGRVRTFKLPKPGETKTNFLAGEMNKAQQWMDRVSKEGELNEIVEGRDKDMVGCASTITSKVTGDSFLNEKYGTQIIPFAQWTAEQIYGCRPETMDAIKAITTDDSLIVELFNQFIQNVAASDPNRFIRILSTIVDKKAVEETVNEMLDGEKKQLPVALKTKPNPKKWKRTVRIPKNIKPEDKKLYDTPLAPWDWDLNAMLDVAFSQVTPVKSVDKDEKQKPRENAVSWWDRHLENAHAGTTASLRKEQELAAM